MTWADHAASSQGVAPPILCMSSANRFSAELTFTVASSPGGRRAATRSQLHPLRNLPVIPIATEQQARALVHSAISTASPGSFGIRREERRRNCPTGAFRCVPTHIRGLRNRDATEKPIRQPRPYRDWARIPESLVKSSSAPSGKQIFVDNPAPSKCEMNARSMTLADLGNFSTVFMASIPLNRQ